MAEQDQNRNESATPYKLEEARKKGSVPKSLDINSLMVLGAAVLTLYVWGPHIANGELVLFQHILSNAAQGSFELSELSEYLALLMSKAMQLLAPLFLLLIVLSVLSSLIQTGPVFSFFALKPDWDRVNPIAGLKRMFSLKLLLESVKTVLKFLFLGSVLYTAISAAMPHFINTFQVHPAALGSVLFPEVRQILFKLLMAFAIVACMDLIYSRWDFGRRMRMSRKDISDEHKRREGDPRIKSRVRELQREALKRSKSMGRVKDADVLITNPTHFAIAIKYEKDIKDAPLVIAKGAGFLAARMRAIARLHQVPIIESRALARSLFHQVAIDQAVPTEHYNALAKILLWAYAAKGITIKPRASST
jgi:flagellar biosynthetic protein FlhB